MFIANVTLACRRLQRVLLWEVQRLAIDRLQRMSSLRVLQVGTSPSLQAMPRLQALLRPSLPSLCPQLQQLLWPPISRHKWGNRKVKLLAVFISGSQSLISFVYRTASPLWWFDYIQLPLKQEYHIILWCVLYFIMQTYIQYVLRHPQ